MVKGKYSEFVADLENYDKRLKFEYPELGEPDTLLGNFVRDKISRYEEPSRKGTPKGEPIGFSKIKYTASLYAITNIKLTDIARILEVSYGVLRKWRTEKEFQENINNHNRKFSERVFNRILERAESRNTTHPKPVSIGFDEFRDANLYSLETRHAITSFIFSRISRGIYNSYVAAEAMNVLDALAFYSREGSELIEAEERRRLKESMEGLIHEIRSYFLEPSLSGDNHHDRVIKLLSELEEYTKKI